MKYPSHLLKLINVLKKLPGVGNKSAERFAFQMLNWSKESLDEMSEIVKGVSTELHSCVECGCLMDHRSCFFCHSASRNKDTLCLLASPRDVFSVESTQEYKGLYHILGGLLNPLDGFHTDQLSLDKLKGRIVRLHVQELVIALDSTLEGDATALYLKQELQSYQLQITRLAFGLPMGSSLEYVDGGTLARAFSGRSHF